LNFLISMTNLNKLFVLTLLMTIINVPMYFYSKTLVKSSVTHEELITSDQGSDHEKKHMEISPVITRLKKINQKRIRLRKIKSIKTWQRKKSPPVSNP
jgi:hypothetical protein